MGAFTVLRPVYERTGEVLNVPDGKPVLWERVSWLAVGPARDEADAKARYRPIQYGYALVMTEGDYIPGRSVIETRAKRLPLRDEDSAVQPRPRDGVRPG